jgi:hypothetical protein
MFGSKKDEVIGRGEYIVTRSFVFVLFAKCCTDGKMKFIRVRWAGNVA